MAVCSFRKFPINVLKLYRIGLRSDLCKSMIYFMIAPEIFPKCNSITKRQNRPTHCLASGRWKCSPVYFIILIAFGTEFSLRCLNTVFLSKSLIKNIVLGQY
jgi:hypothetical protein